MEGVKYTLKQLMDHDAFFFGYELDLKIVFFFSYFVRDKFIIMKI